MNRLLHTIVSSVAILLLPQPAHGDESKDHSVTKHRRFGRLDLPADSKRDQIFDNLSDTDKSLIEDLWKAISQSPTATKLSQRTSASLYNFEKEYWRIFDKLLLQRSSSTPARMLGMSLTDPSIEPDYPRHGVESAPYDFGKHSSKGPSSSGAAIGDGVRLLATKQLSLELTELLKKLVISFKSFKNNFHDVDSTSREASRKELVDLAGEEAVNELETQLRERKI